MTMIIGKAESFMTRSRFNPQSYKSSAVESSVSEGMLYFARARSACLTRGGLIEINDHKVKTRHTAKTELWQK